MGNKPFRAWDGEGRVVNGKHELILLANSDGERIESADGLSTRDCALFLTRKRAPAINVWYAFGYDVNKILRDLPLHGRRASLEHLWTSGRTWWYGLFVKYLPRKFFSLSYGSLSFHSTDVFSFFQKSFLRACADWRLDAESIEAGKRERENFSQWTIAEIAAYNDEELRLLVRLLNDLRDAFAKTNLVPSSWHGPGAVANRWLRRERMHEHYAPLPKPVEAATRYAFFGGRIDVACIGEEAAYQYDLASAYPKGLTHCLSLPGLSWEPSCEVVEHGLYRVRWSVPRWTLWGPFPWRSAHGGVLYPPVGEGWYHGIEVLAARRLFGDAIDVLEGWRPVGAHTFPFREPVERDYAMRAEYKRAEHAAHITIRLGLNSLYGKCCQHLGYNGKPPRWQNYLWAGFTTAHTRARILDAIAGVGAENVLAVCTDGIFTRVPLAPEPAALGSWESKGRYPTLFVAPGLYAIMKPEGETVIRQRGMPGAINYGWLLRSWGCETRHNTRGANASFSRFSQFVGMGRALHQDVPHGEFIDQERSLKNVALIGTSKRIGNPEAFGAPWESLALYPKPRLEECISYPYRWRPEYDPREENE